MDLFREGTPGRWLWIALAAWAGVIILIALVQTAYGLLYYGPRSYFRNAFRIDPGTWWLIAVLVLIGVAAASVWSQPLF